MKRGYATLTVIAIALLIYLNIGYDALVTGEAKTQTVSDSVSMPVVYVPNYPVTNSNFDEVTIEPVEQVEEVSPEPKRPQIPNLGLDDKLLDYIWQKSLGVNLSYELILAIIQIESNYGKDKINKNKNGSVDSGLLQVNSSMVPFLSKLAGIKKVDPMNNQHSIDMGIALLLYEREYFRSLDMSEEMVFDAVIVAYNRGRGNTIKYIENGTLSKHPYLKKIKEIKYSLEQEVTVSE